MAEAEIQTILQDLKSNETATLIQKIHAAIGKDDNTNDSVLEYMSKNKVTSTIYLPICYLLILEKSGCVLDIVKRILIENPGSVHGFVSDLIKSKYYVHRKMVALLLPDISLESKKYFLKQCFNDDVSVVIHEATLSLSLYNELPLTDDELLEIAMDLNNHHSDFVQCCVPDILIHIKQRTHLIVEICMSDSYRKKLALVTKIKHFQNEDVVRMYEILCKDKEQLIRQELAENIDLLSDYKSYAELFLKDEDPKVRSIVVKKLANHPEYYDKLKDMVDDTSWEVKKELLHIENDTVYESLSLPIINSIPNDLNWRLRREVLESIYHISVKNEVLIKKFLLDQIFKYMEDRACQVRIAASTILCELINKYDWSVDWKDRIEKLVKSTNYLYRITVVPVCYAYDKKFKTSFLANMLDDVVVNVKVKVLKTLSVEDVDAEIIGKLKKYKDDVDSEVRSEVGRLIGDK